MSNPLPDQITELVYREFSYFNEPQALKNVIFEFACRINGQVSELTLAEDILGPDLQVYISSLARKEQECRKTGLFCPYELFPDRDEIVGYSYPRSTDTSLARKVRRIAPEIQEVLDTIRSLQPENFELFCSRILSLLGAEETLKTQYSKDDGIDFLGWLYIPDTFVATETILQFRREFRMLVLGQAKRYKPENPIGVNHIRELVGTVAAFHHDQLAPWESKLQLPSFTVLAPILPLMMTTGRISRDAKNLAKKCGVVTREGVDIALFIGLEGIGVTEVEENGISRLKFDRQRFNDWLYQTPG